MSIRKMSEVWEYSRHNGTALLMLLAIADFSDDDGRAYPSVGSLAAKCRMKSRNANVILAALRDSGELEIRIGEGPRGTNLYRVKPLQSFASPPVKHCTPAKECSKPLQGNAPKPSVNRKPNPIPPHPLSGDDGVSPLGWDEYWATYPRKEAKLKALRAWRKVNPNDALRARIMAALLRQKESEQWRKDGGRFVPHPASWLNGRRWEDRDQAETRGLVL